MSTSTHSVLSNETLCRLLKLDFIIIDALGLLQPCFSSSPCTSYFQSFNFCGICTRLILLLNTVNEEEEEPKNWKVSKVWFGDELICSLV